MELSTGYRLFSPNHSGKTAMRQFIIWNTIHNEYGSASWAVIDGVVTVRTSAGSKSEMLGRLEPKILATCLMADLASEREQVVA